MYQTFTGRNTVTLEENYVLLGYCAASSGKFLPTFRDPEVPKRR